MGSTVSATAHLSDDGGVVPSSQKQRNGCPRRLLSVGARIRFRVISTGPGSGLETADRPKGGRPVCPRGDRARLGGLRSRPGDRIHRTSLPATLSVSAGFQPPQPAPACGTRAVAIDPEPSRRSPWLPASGDELAQDRPRSWNGSPRRPEMFSRRSSGASAGDARCSPARSAALPACSRRLRPRPSRHSPSS